MDSWRERFPQVYEEQRAYWTSKGFRVVDDPAGDLTFTGTITVRLGGEQGLEQHAFTLTVTYPPAYPYVPPHVAFVDPSIKRSRHQGLDGRPCLFPASAWTLAAPAHEVYASVERWLACHVADRFPRELATYELPEYFVPSALSVLVAPEAIQQMADGTRGTFSVDELHGRDLAVVRSVDETDHGREVHSALIPARVGERRRENGRWYRLDDEPPAIRHCNELASVLQASGHTVNLTKRPRRRELIGLSFRDRVLDEERLLLLDIGVKPAARAPVGRGWPVRAPSVYPVSLQDLQRRLTAVRDVDALSATHVACFGLGAIGAPNALALAREGVGEFTLCDQDTLRPGNVVRHSLDLTSVGQLKALAVEDAICRVNPFVETTAYHQNLTDPGSVATYMRHADLVVAAIGNDLTEELLCEILNNEPDERPLVMARTLHGGAAYRVVVHRPGIDACLTCLAAYRNEGHPEWIDVPADDRPDVFDAGCAAAARPGAGLTSLNAASFAAGRCLELLEGRAPDTNHWVWVEQPIAGGDPRLQEARTLHVARFAPRPDCPVCGV